MTFALGGRAVGARLPPVRQRPDPTPLEPPTDRSTRRSPRHASRLSRSLARRVAGHPIAAGLVLGAAASALVGLGAVASAAPDPSDIFPLSSVKPGMKGYGLTVFSGTTPEKFEVEVISVLRNFRPNQDLILIKTPNHPRLNAARTVAGMSGSPIYFDGKMAGAYAYGWLFGVEPVAGVTPIKSMLEEQARPIPKGLMPGRGGPLPVAGDDKRTERPKRQFMGSIDRYDLTEHKAQLASWMSPSLAAPEGGTLARLSTPLLMGGLGNTSIAVAQKLFAPLGLEPVQAGGSGNTPAADAPTKFVDGGAIGVELVRGDVSAMGLGTVTRVQGDKLVAFGHPMLNGGIEALPTAIAKVHWILASHQRSFKIGEAARSMGTLVNDRQAAIVVDSSMTAPTFPVKLTLEGVAGAPKPVWNMTVAHDEFMAPSLTAMALGNAVETTTGERGDTTWRAVSTIKVKKYGTVQVLDFASGAGVLNGPEDLIRSRLVRALGALLNNPWEDVTIEGVETTLKVAYERELFILRGTKLLDHEVDAGQKVRVQLELEGYKGKRETRILEITIPSELAGKEIDIDLEPGYEIEKPAPTPTTVAGLVTVLNAKTYDPESIVATIRLKDVGATHNGKIATNLPAGVIDMLRPSHDSRAPELFAVYQHTEHPMKKFVVGRDTVRVKVRAILK